MTTKIFSLIFYCLSFILVAHHRLNGYVSDINWYSSERLRNAMNKRPVSVGQVCPKIKQIHFTFKRDITLI